MRGIRRTRVVWNPPTLDERIAGVRGPLEGLFRGDLSWLAPWAEVSVDLSGAHGNHDSDGWTDVQRLVSDLRGREREDRVAFVGMAAAMIQILNDGGLTLGGALGALEWVDEAPRRLGLPRSESVRAIGGRSRARLPNRPTMGTDGGGSPRRASADEAAPRDRASARALDDRLALAHLVDCVIGAEGSPQVRLLLRRASRSPLAAPQPREWVAALARSAFAGQSRSWFEVPDEWVEVPALGSLDLHIVLLGGDEHGQSSGWRALQSQWTASASRRRVMVISGQSGESLVMPMAIPTPDLQRPRVGTTQIVYGTELRDSVAGWMNEALRQIEGDGIAVRSVLVDVCQAGDGDEIAEKFRRSPVLS